MFWEAPERRIESIPYSGRLGNPGEIGGVSTGSYCTKIKCTPNWLFAGSDRAGRRSTVIMSLIQTAKLHGIDPYAYLRDVLERLPLTPHSRIGELLPGAWKLSRPTTH